MKIILFMVTIQGANNYLINKEQQKVQYKVNINVRIG